MAIKNQQLQFSKTQRLHAWKWLCLQLGIGWLGTDIVLYLLYNHAMAPLSFSGVLSALVFTLKWQAYSLLMLLVMVYTVIVKRALNIAAAVYPIQTAQSGQDIGIVTHNAVLRNTVEQWVIYLPLVLLTSVLLTEANGIVDMRIIPLVSGTFLLGRALYWAGYVYNSLLRVFGIAMTLHLSLYMAVYGVYYAI